MNGHISLADHQAAMQALREDFAADIRRLHDRLLGAESALEMAEAEVIALRQENEALDAEVRTVIDDARRALFVAFGVPPATEEVPA